MFSGQECLNIFGASSSASGNTSVKMCYGGYGQPLVLTYVIEFRSLNCYMIVTFCFYTGVTIDEPVLIVKSPT